MKRLLPALLLLGLLAGCGHSSTKSFDPAQVNFAARYNPLFGNLLYPSFVMGMANYTQDRKHRSDTNAIFTVSVTAPADNAVLRVVLDSSQLNYITIFQETLPKQGERYYFYPQVKWKYDNLYRIRQQGAVDLTFTCYINDEEVDIKNLRLNYRSANECVLSIKSPGGTTYDLRWLFAAYVNEEHPIIDDILNEVLGQGVVNKITGYQGGSDAVVKQVEAVWYYLLEHGIRYSSISCTSNPDKRSNVQHIRFFDEVYNTRQANCIDACVFMASILRKIGLKPVIFVAPCHAYLGYYTDRNRRSMWLLETTITGWVDFPALTRNYENVRQATPHAHGANRISAAYYKKYANYLTEGERKQWEKGKMTFSQFKHCIAHNLFNKASQYNIEEHNLNKQHFLDKENTQYQQLDIEQLRSFVQPINGGQ